MANKHVKTHSTFQPSGTCKFKPQGDTTSNPVEWLKVNNTQVSVTEWINWTSHKMQNGRATVEKGFAVAYTVKHTHTIRPRNFSPCILLKRNKNTCSHKSKHMYMHTHTHSEHLYSLLPKTENN